MITKDEMTAVLNRTLALSDSDRIQLGRMTGYNVQNAMSTIRGRKAVIIFMSLFPDEMYEKLSKTARDVMFFACCGACAQVRNGKAVTIEWYISRIYNDENNTSDSQRARIREMLSEDVTMNGNLIRRLGAYVQRAQREGFRIDFYRMAWDLLFWNFVNKWSRERWVRRIMRIHDDTDENGDGNGDEISSTDSVDDEMNDSDDSKSVND